MTTNVKILEHLGSQ